MTFPTVEPCVIPPIDPGWFTQPVATVIAAGIAVVAAGIAYAGVAKTVRSNRLESRRKEKVDTLVDALTSLQTIARLIAQCGMIADPAERDAAVRNRFLEPFLEASDMWTVANGKLVLFGMTDVLKPIKPFIERSQVVWAEIVATPGYAVDAAEIFSLFNKVAPAFEAEMRKLK